MMKMLRRHDDVESPEFRSTALSNHHNNIMENNFPQNLDEEKSDNNSIVPSSQGEPILFAVEKKICAEYPENNIIL